MSLSIRAAFRRPLTDILTVAVPCLVLASGIAGAPTIGQSPGVSVWTERQLDVVPEDNPPNTAMWDTWIAFTDDLAHIAYAARFRSGDRMRESVVFDGRRGPEFVYASRPALSPDGRRLAFLGVTPGDRVLPAYLVLGAARVQVQIKDQVLGPTWVPVFSPDGNKLAFRAERPSGRYAIGVLDVAAVQAEPDTAESAVVWGPEFIDMDLPKWAPDSSAVAYAAARTSSEWVVMVGTEPRAIYKDVTGVTFSPSGVLAYQGTDESGHFVMIGDQRQASFNVVTDPTFRADGTVVYGATEAGRHYVVVGSQKREVPKPVEGAAVSADGDRVTWWFREDERRRMVINGVRGPRFSRRVTRPVLHAEAGTFTRQRATTASTSSRRAV